MDRLPAVLRLCLLLLGIHCAAGASRAADPACAWPQFRGPTGQGIADAKGLPIEWSETEHIAWKTPLSGKAWSSPVICGDQVWVSNATEDGKTLSAVCLDRSSGKVIHDLKLFDVPNPQFVHSFNSHGSPTPVIEAGRIYVTFGAAGGACIDTASGKVLWQRRDIIVNHFRGAGSSPILFDDLLIMNFDGSDAQFIIALDKRTGETKWKTERSVDFQDLDPKTGKPSAGGDFRKAFSTPRIASFKGDDRPVLISAGSKALYAYDPATGKERWRVENRAQHSTSSTPVIGADLIYFCTGHGRGELWAVKPGGQGVAGPEQVAWKVKKNIPTRSSPLLLDGLLYMVDDGGVVSCLDAASGDEIWKGRLPGAYSASPLFADGRIYFFNEDGKHTAIAPGREFKIVGQGQLDSGYMATPAVANNALYLRTRAALYEVKGDREKLKDERSGGAEEKGEVKDKR